MRGAGAATGRRCRPAVAARDVAYDVKDVIGTGGFGIGSAGLPAYNVLLEGYDQALENDVVLSIKQGNVAAPSRIVDDPEIRGYFEHEGHRTAVSQRALQANASQFLGYTEIGGTGFVVAELSPYELDLDWEDLTEPDQIRPVMVQLGPGDGEAALRRRRRQRPHAGAVPDGGGDHRDDRRPPRGVRRRPRRASPTTTPGGPRTTTGASSTPSAPARSRGSARAGTTRRWLRPRPEARPARGGEGARSLPCRRAGRCPACRRAR